MLTIPRDALVNRLRPFKANENDFQAGLSARIRRDALSFLWVTIMGVQNCNPGDDPYLQLCLQWYYLQRLLRGVNTTLEHTDRTKDDFGEICKYYFEVGRNTVEEFDIRVNSELHKLMWHLRTQMQSHGCMRCGDSDENEELHKISKAAYNSYLSTGSSNSSFPPRTP